ncbi:hypothetical protein A4A49_51380 [Nicotiana attenuata]|uniref:RNase H type-1 domain-containing protein n=1 Tax=Nicotiana attenuata TaxID=49451 RepID=A0A1J6ILX1_NICAT|nr:hypothetical protein A4A49_51380 [Nicotiana attenuata]
MTILVHWHPPPPGLYKLSIDEAADPTTILAAQVGFSVTIMAIGFLVTLNHYIELTNTLLAEIQALYHGLQLEITYHLFSILVEIDSQVLLSLLTIGNSKYSHILNTCNLMITDLDMPNVQHTFREVNVVADALAHLGNNKASTLHQDVIIFETPPPFTLMSLLSDSTGTATASSVSSM